MSNLRIVEKFKVVHVFDGDEHLANCGGSDDPNSLRKAHKIVSIGIRIANLEVELAVWSAALLERTAQISAHRGCCGTEHDPANGKLHGYCVVCGVPWPCEYAGVPPSAVCESKP